MGVGGEGGGVKGGGAEGGEVGGGGEGGGGGGLATYETLRKLTLTRRPPTLALSCGARARAKGPTKRPKCPTSWYCCALSERASSGAAPSLAAASATSSGEVQPTCSSALSPPSLMFTVAGTTVGGRTCVLPKRQRGSTRFSRAAASSELPRPSKVTEVPPCSGPTVGWSAWSGLGLRLGLGLGLRLGLRLGVGVGVGVGVERLQRGWDEEEERHSALELHAVERHAEGHRARYRARRGEGVRREAAHTAIRLEGGRDQGRGGWVGAEAAVEQRRGCSHMGGGAGREAEEQ